MAFTPNFEAILCFKQAMVVGFTLASDPSHPFCHCSKANGVVGFRFVTSGSELVCDESTRLITAIRCNTSCVLAKFSFKPCKNLIGSVCPARLQ